MKKILFGLLIVLVVAGNCFADQIKLSTFPTPVKTAKDVNTWLKEHQNTVIVKGAELTRSINPNVSVLIHYESVPAANRPLMQIVLFGYTMGISQTNFETDVNKWLKEKENKIIVNTVKLDSTVLNTGMGNFQTVSIMVLYTIK
jgi:hypothetical protein